MDIVRLSIPYEFIRGLVRMSWREVRFGLDKELLDPWAPVELAIEQAAGLEQPSAALVDLASAEKDNPIMGPINKLADGDPPRSENDIRNRWLYLVLAWLYENRDAHQDPLQKVEEVYADFDYPEQIVKFVRYMPMDGPDLGSREANVKRLFERWKWYLDETARKLVASEK
ncbi:MAG: DUF2247 family protein [Deltaproteobacteria bacterium]|nr:DUF2247 family protein [Deltaproteobacteria bacterium]